MDREPKVIGQIGLPSELPEKPAAWTQKMQMHLNFGTEGGAAIYHVFDAEGTLMPIGYQYDTRKGGRTGFTLPNRDGVMTWAELRQAWPEWVKTQGREGDGDGS